MLPPGDWDLLYMPLLSLYLLLGASLSLTGIQVTARIRATFSMSFFGTLIGTLNLMLSRRPVAQKKALLLGFLDDE